MSRQNTVGLEDSERTVGDTVMMKHAVHWQNQQTVPQEERIVNNDISVLVQKLSKEELTYYCKMLFSLKIYRLLFLLLRL